MSDLPASGRLALAVAATTAFADDMPPFQITNKARTVAPSCQGASLDSGAFAEHAVNACIGLSSPLPSSPSKVFRFFASFTPPTHESR